MAVLREDVSCNQREQVDCAYYALINQQHLFFFWHGILAKIMNCEFFSEGDGFGRDVCSLWGNCQCSTACPTYARKGRRCFFFPGGLFHMRFVSDSLRIISAANGSLCKWMQIGDKLI